jgi:hypothetical protein
MVGAYRRKVSVDSVIKICHQLFACKQRYSTSVFCEVYGFFCAVYALDGAPIIVVGGIFYPLQDRLNFGMLQ